ncbi:MAG: DUF3299 domain-containing protein [Boseongicola sp.]|nr:DUF3299 domain-containing protein [Boseongicola sp.]
MAAVSLLSDPALAEDFIDLEWEDLLPEGQTFVPNVLQGLIPHDETALASQQSASTGVRTDWNGKIVRLPGFVVPLDFSGQGVSAFILVPFVGACVHVPPPPANQLVLVTVSEPFESKGLYEPVNVIGMFGTTSIRTQLAEVGYALSADRIEPYT